MRQLTCLSLILLFVVIKGQDANKTSKASDSQDTLFFKFESIINGIYINEWTAADQIIPMNHQFIKIQYSSQNEPITLDYNISSEKQNVAFYVAREIHSGTLKYENSTKFQINATKAKQSFIIVFQCYEDGIHQVHFGLQYKTQFVKLDFKKECGKISNSSLYINLISEPQFTNVTVIQNQLIHLQKYESSCNSLELQLYTSTNSQILMEAPIIQNQTQQHKSHESHLGDQSAEFRNNNKNGGLVSIDDNLNINIKYVCLQVSEVIYTVTLNSAIFQAPFIFEIVKSCVSGIVPITNFTQFPIKIGTIKDKFDVYRPGQVADEYNKSTKYIRVIPEEEDAEMFYITVMKDEYGQNLLKRNLILRNPILEYNQDILHIINDVPKLGQQFWRKPLDILLIFKCRKAGKSQVKMELDFYYGDKETQTISIYFIKVCAAPTNIQETSVFGDLFYYSICLLAILFGLYIINLFKNMMQKEASQETFNIDTSYKRKYDKMQELPIKSTTVVLQE